MKKFLLLVALASSLALAPSALADWINPAIYRAEAEDDLCSTLRYTCNRQLRMNDTANRALRRHQRYSTLSTPDSCIRWSHECDAYRTGSAYGGSCTGTCPDGTTYNACSSLTGSDPCRLHREPARTNCPVDTVPQRICTNTYPIRCYEACSAARTECTGYCSNGRTYNICTMGPTYECLGR